METILSDSSDEESDEEEVFECNYCETRAIKTQKGLVSHIVKCHPNHVIEADETKGCHQCDNCFLWFISLRKLYRHQKSIHLAEDKPLICTHPGCDYECRNPKGFYYHKQKHSMKPSFVCTVTGCDKQFYTEGNMTRHVFNTHCEKTIACSHGCGKMFKIIGHMRGHVESVHMRVKNERCEWPGCDYASYYKKDIVNHYKNRHTNDKKIVCQLCDKRFITRSHLKDHQKSTHKIGPPLVCSWPECQYSTHNRQSMANHMSYHKLGPRFVCPWPGCDKRLMSKLTLEDHINAIHKKLKPFLCPVMDCSYRTAFKRCIRQHMRTHQK